MRLAFYRLHLHSGQANLCLIYIKVGCSQCRRLLASLESSDQVTLHPIHYASQWKGPTDKDSYINKKAQMGLYVEVRFLWVISSYK